MKATLRLKLHMDEAIHTLLLETMIQSTECFNAVCRYGWESHDFNGVSLHRTTYNSLCRLHPEMPSQLIVSARMKAVEALKSVNTRIYQRKKASCPQSQLCAIRYDARSYWVKLKQGEASLVTIGGRVKVGFSLPRCANLSLLAERLCRSVLRPTQTSLLSTCRPQERRSCSGTERQGSRL